MSLLTDYEKELLRRIAAREALVREGESNERFQLSCAYLRQQRYINKVYEQGRPLFMLTDQGVQVAQAIEFDMARSQTE